MSHRSTSVGVVRMTGIALGWISATIALGFVVRKPKIKEPSIVEQSSSVSKSLEFSFDTLASKLASR